VCVAIRDKDHLFEANTATSRTPSTQIRGSTAKTIPRLKFITRARPATSHHVRRFVCADSDAVTNEERQETFSKLYFSAVWMIACAAS